MASTGGGAGEPAELLVARGQSGHDGLVEHFLQVSLGQGGGLDVGPGSDPIREPDGFQLAHGLLTIPGQLDEHLQERENMISHII